MAVALPGRRKPVFRGEMANRHGSLRRLMSRLSAHGDVQSFCYEASPCEYGLYRESTEAFHECAVVAPSLIPRKSGDRVKMDRRDALTLARFNRPGDLTSVWVPGPEQEAMRDLARTREDMKAIQLKARQRLGAFLLRHGRVYYTGRSRWTQAPVAGLEGQMRQALATWSLRPAVEAWAAQKRLCARYRHLHYSGKAKCKVTVAVARELVGFIWAIASEVYGRPHASRGDDLRVARRDPYGQDRA